MPDITMCNNDTCPLRKDCYRHEAEPNPYRQSYTMFKYLDWRGDDFVPIADRSQFANGGSA